ncbi:MAG: hypothetical protein Q8R07_03160, partial [Candidatus Uhrbacteria bacterium]|nr:hypothetical protein [Candidatus Uhrbacteria bacterium]
STHGLIPSMIVRFTKHAQEKFSLLRRHGVSITATQVTVALEKPDFIDYSHLPLLIAQIGFDAHRVLRVVYRQEGNVMTVITFYPGRRKQYEKK